jgi:hypothetical protein
MGSDDPWAVDEHLTDKIVGEKKVAILGSIAGSPFVADICAALRLYLVRTRLGHHRPPCTKIEYTSMVRCMHLQGIAI